MRGIAIDVSRSKNSHMYARRRVTLTPTGMPSRSLKAAIDFFARRTLGCWPAIVASCLVAASKAFESVFAAPSPMLSVIFSSRGTCIAELYLKRSWRALRTSCS